MKNFIKNSQRKYSEDFKKTIVTLCESGKTYSDIKKEYEVSSSPPSNNLSNVLFTHYHILRFQNNKNYSLLFPVRSILK